MNNKNLKTSILSGIIYASGMTIFLPIILQAQTTIMMFCLTFVFCFLFWVILMYLFLQSQSKKLEEMAKDIDDEILYQGLANHIYNGEATGGYIFITKDRLIFKTHSLNMQNHSIEILLKDITALDKYNNLGFIKNGLIVTYNNNKDKFVVNDMDKIIKIINFTQS